MPTVRVSVKGNDRKALGLLRAIALQHGGHSIGGGFALRQVNTPKQITYTYNFPTKEKAEGFRRDMGKIMSSSRAMTTINEA